MKYYAGIGSRKTPKDILDLMHSIARGLYHQGYTLRSGGAPGADQAFEWGVWNSTQREVFINPGITPTEIFLPWKSFEEGTRPPFIPKLEEPQKEAYNIAAEFHPQWKFLKWGAKKLQARNVHQVLGPDVTNPTPSEFIICWTPKAAGSGGTGQAIRIAKAWEVPVYDLADDQQLFELKVRLNGSFII